MTGAEIITQFQFLVDDDNTSEAQALILLNIAYKRLLASREWNFLNKGISSDTVASGTSAYALPSDFLSPMKITLQNSANLSDYYEMSPVPWRRRLEYASSDNYFYIDPVNSNYVFTKSPPASRVGWAVFFDYLYEPSDIASGTSPIFNSAFHPIIAYEMARHFWYNEQDEKSRMFNNEMNAEYVLMLNQMQQWDERIGNSMEPSLESISPWPGAINTL
jgi:hypothetical protein